jgi:hypothetical protein
VLDFAECAEQAAAIDTQPGLRFHQAELNREPEEARHRFHDAGEATRAFGFVADARDQFDRGVRRFAEAQQNAGACGIGVYEDMAGDVVEDIGLRKVVELVRWPDGDSGGECVIAQAIEKQKRRDVAADRLRLKAS